MLMAACNRDIPLAAHRITTARWARRDAVRSIHRCRTTKAKRLAVETEQLSAFAFQDASARCRTRCRRLLVAAAERASRMTVADDALFAAAWTVANEGDSLIAAHDGPTVTVTHLDGSNFPAPSANIRLRTAKRARAKL